MLEVTEMTLKPPNLHGNLLQIIQSLLTNVLAFCLGKSYAEKRRLQRQAKQLQQWRQNQYKSFTDVSKALRKGKFIVLLCLWAVGGCATSTIVCPELVEYTIEEQLELDRQLMQSASPLLKRYITDYANLRFKLRQCY